MAKPAREAVEVSELFMELFHDHRRKFMSLAKEYGLTPQQNSTLYMLAPGQRIAMNELAEMLMCDASNVTGIVDKLEARGLAKRGQAEDRRVKVLTLTAAGEALRVEMLGRLLEPPPWLLDLSRDDQRTLRDLLRRAVEHAKPSAE
jgi:MarR family transcriptional regulator, organic hydroperoxide resistance regulator